MSEVITNRAEIEYAVMLAVLDFQTEFMNSASANIQTYVFDELIYITSTRSASIPAEKALARLPEGHELLRRFHRALFDSCQHVLQTRIEQAIGVKIQTIVTDFNPETGLNTVVIKLLEPITQLPAH